MLNNNFALYGVKIFIEIARDILLFPLWWYSRGLWQVIKNRINFLKERQKSLALLVWIKNIFRPMYGQRDWQGMLISIFIRLIQIIFRGLFMVFYVIFSILLVLVWIVLPVFVVIQIFFQFF